MKLEDEHKCYWRAGTSKYWVGNREENKWIRWIGYERNILQIAIVQNTPIQLHIPTCFKIVDWMSKRFRIAVACVRNFGQGIVLVIIWSSVRTLPSRVYGGALVVWSGMPLPNQWWNTSMLIWVMAVKWRLGDDYWQLQINVECKQSIMLGICKRKKFCWIQTVSTNSSKSSNRLDKMKEDMMKKIWL